MARPMLNSKQEYDPDDTVRVKAPVFLTTLNQVLDQELEEEEVNNELENKLDQLAKSNPPPSEQK